jgi:hypothetical protein
MDKPAFACGRWRRNNLGGPQTADDHTLLGIAFLPQNNNLIPRLRRTRQAPPVTHPRRRNRKPAGQHPLRLNLNANGECRRINRGHDGNAWMRPHLIQLRRLTLQQI